MLPAPPAYVFWGEMIGSTAGMTGCATIHAAVDICHFDAALAIYHDLPDRLLLPAEREASVASAAHSIIAKQYLISPEASPA